VEIGYSGFRGRVFLVLCCGVAPAFRDEAPQIDNLSIRQVNFIRSGEVCGWLPGELGMCSIMECLADIR